MGSTSAAVLYPRWLALADDGRWSLEALLQKSIGLLGASSDVPSRGEGEEALGSKIPGTKKNRLVTGKIDPFTCGPQGWGFLFDPKPTGSFYSLSLYELMVFISTSFPIKTYGYPWIRS